MSPFLDARNKLPQPRIAPRSLNTFCHGSKAAPTRSGCAFPRQTRFPLGAVILALGFGASGSVPAAPENDVAQQQTPSAPSTRTSPIRITRHQPEPVDPLLTEAYLAYRNGRLADAQRLYLAMLKKDAHNFDALLGLAAIAQQQQENLIAAQYYSQVLLRDPRNALAHAGMSALSTDDDSNESRLKILLREQANSAALHFALGNLFARQSRWSEARQAYSNACLLEPGNAAFAFNLAVSLDHLGQRNPAAQHYRTALQLDQANSTGLDHEQISQRISILLQ